MASSRTPSAPPLETLYSQHHAWLLGWLRFRLGNAFDAADVAHDTFVRLLASRHTPAEAIQEPRAYLSTVAKGLLANRYRRLAVERAYAEALAQAPEAVAPSEEQRLIILETLHRIDAALDTLKADARRAFLLSQLDGLGYDAIAAQLGLSLTTIKRYMRQGFRACLAVMLE